MSLKNACIFQDLELKAALAESSTPVHRRRRRRKKIEMIKAAEATKAANNHQPQEGVRHSSRQHRTQRYAKLYNNSHTHA